jgi:hypothetical protein
VGCDGLAAWLVKREPKIFLEKKVCRRRKMVFWGRGAVSIDEKNVILRLT